MKIAILIVIVVLCMGIMIYALAKIAKKSHVQDIISMEGFIDVLAEAFTREKNLVSEGVSISECAKDIAENLVMALYDDFVALLANPYPPSMVTISTYSDQITDKFVQSILPNIKSACSQYCGTTCKLRGKEQEALLKKIILTKLKNL